MCRQVGIGSVDSGKLFAEQLDLPEALELYADPSGACHQALGFSTGALPQSLGNGKKPQEFPVGTCKGPRAL